MFRQLTSALAFIFAVTYANGGLANSSDNSLSHQKNTLTRDSIVVGKVSTNLKSTLSTSNLLRIIWRTI